MAYRASKQGHIVFDDCRIPEENLVGNEGTGFYMLAEFFNQGRIVVGGHGLGMAAAAIEEAWEFVHDREAFGRDVSEFQAVQHDLAEMLMEFERARALNWRAADKVAEPRPDGLLGRARQSHLHRGRRRVRRARDAAPRRALRPHREPYRAGLPRLPRARDLRGCERRAAQPDLPPAAHIRRLSRCVLSEPLAETDLARWEQFVEQCFRVVRFDREVADERRTLDREVTHEQL